MMMWSTKIWNFWSFYRVNFFSLFSGWRICIPIESGFIQPDFFFVLFRRFLVFFGIFFYISSGSNGRAGGVWCVFGIAQLGEIISKGAIVFFFFTCIFTRYLWNFCIKFVRKIWKISRVSACVNMKIRRLVQKQFDPNVG